MARAIRDFYRVLGVSALADPVTIRRAYRELIEDIQDEHEALGPSEELSEARSDADEAYAVLSDLRSRGAFDALRSHVGWSDATDGADEEEVAEPRDVPRAEVVELALRRLLESGDEVGSRVLEFKLPFELAALGGRTRVRLPIRAACPECAGLGGESEHATRCERCEGASEAFEACPSCGGRGWVVSFVCARCGGEGWVPALGAAELVIPPGITDGTLLPFPGFAENHEAQRAPRVRVKVSSHPFFERVGLDILCRVPVSKGLAEKGSTIRVKTLRGEDHTLKLPPDTPDGTVLRLEGEGIDADGQRGDQLVEIRVRAPRGRK